METGKEIFVDLGPVVLTGEAARERLAKTNDRRFLVPGHGIPRVDAERWALAQKSENLHWFESNGGSKGSDDRNLSHASRFAGYDALRGMKFSHALELGCGPFGNLRLIGRVCQISSCTLLDPTLGQYLNHRASYFTQQSLFTAPISRTYSRLWPKLRRIAVARPAWFKPVIPIRQLLAIGAEEIEGVSADLVVMVNVLEHCLDAELVLHKAWSCVAPGGIMVLSDKVHEDSAVVESVNRVYDSAHPLRITIAAFEPILRHAEVIFENSTIDAVSEWIPHTYERYWILRKPFEKNQP